MKYNVQIGKFSNKEHIETIDLIKDNIIKNYKDDLKNRSSLHKYISKTPNKFQKLVNKLRNSKEIKNKICSQYNNCNIINLENTDEIYISHYNIDGGGDQGLYDKHYDGVLRFINDATIVRALIYINSNDNYIVHFLDSNISKNFSNYEYAIIDFNREYHYVEGNYDPTINYKDSRILLKLNYLVCPKCSNLYKKFLIKLNMIIFYIVKSSMEYSKSPKNIFQYIIGFFCNFFRIVNNISVYFTFLLIILICILFYYLLLIILKFIGCVEIPSCMNLY
jgi:hypothetical protein